MELHKNFKKGDIIVDKETNKEYKLLDNGIYNNSFIAEDISLCLAIRIYYNELDHYESELVNILKKL